MDSVSEVVMDTCCWDFGSQMAATQMVDELVIVNVGSRGVHQSQTPNIFFSFRCTSLHWWSVYLMGIFTLRTNWIHPLAILIQNLGRVESDGNSLSLAVLIKNQDHRGVGIHSLVGFGVLILFKMSVIGKMELSIRLSSLLQ